MKKGMLVLLLVSVSLINFASAGFISDGFDMLGIENVVLVLTFLISFTIINFSLSKIFRGNKGLSGVLAFLVALGITAGINYYEIDLSGFLFDLGIAEDILFPIIFLILIAGIVIFIWKKGLGILFMIIGALLFTLSWISYEDTLVRYISAFFFIIGAFLWWRKNHPKGDRSPGFWTKNRDLPGSKGLGKWQEKRKLQKEYNKLKSNYSKARNSNDIAAMRGINEAIKNLANQARGKGIKLKY